MPDTAAFAAPSAELRPASGPQAWFGPDMADRTGEWLHRLTAAEVVDLAAAVDHAGERDILDLGRADFPLPALAPTLARIRRDVLHGRGFALIRGVPVERWTVRQAAVAYWALGTHLGEPCSQNGKGHVLGHVQDLGYDYSQPEARGYQTSARLNYHTDSSDMVGLLCLKPAKDGGLSSIASSVTCFNEMLRRRPDLAAVLTRPVYRTRWGEIPEGRKPWSEVPVFNPFEDSVVTTYVRSAIRKGQSLPGVPPLTDAQNEAMDMLDALANDPSIHLDMEFRPGDVQLLNNHRILHSRTAYVDFAEPERRRHLLRLWLACDDGPALPPWITREWQGMTATGRPNGIQVPGVPFSAPLEAE